MIFHIGGCRWGLGEDWLDSDEKAAESSPRFYDLSKDRVVARSYLTLSASFTHTNEKKVLHTSSHTSTSASASGPQYHLQGPYHWVLYHSCHCSSSHLNHQVTISFQFWIANFSWQWNHWVLGVGAVNFTPIRQETACLYAMCKDFHPRYKLKLWNM